MAALGSGGLLDLLLSAINKEDPDSQAEERYLTALLDAASKTINGQVRKPLDMDRVDDQLLVVDYAQFLWRSRALGGDDAKMPKNLRERINQRTFELSRDRRNRHEAGRWNPNGMPNR